MEPLNLCSYPTVDSGTAPNAFPQALPAPCPGQSCKYSGIVLNFSIDLYKVFADSSIAPISPAAVSSKSGLPTSPTKTKSPESNPIGSSVVAPSVTRKLMCSGV